jgi:hypothetical protein
MTSRLPPGNTPCSPALDSRALFPLLASLVLACGEPPARVPAAPTPSPSPPPSAPSASAAGSTEPAPGPPIDAAPVFSIVLRGNATIRPLGEETLLTQGPLVLHVVGNALQQDARDLRGLPHHLALSGGPQNPDIRGARLAEAHIALFDEGGRPPAAFRGGELADLMSVAIFRASAAGLFEQVVNERPGELSRGFHLLRPGVWQFLVANGGKQRSVHLAGPESPSPDDPSPALPGHTTSTLGGVAPDGTRLFTFVAGHAWTSALQRPGGAGLTTTAMPPGFGPHLSPGLRMSAPDVGVVNGYIDGPPPRKQVHAVFDGTAWEIEPGPEGMRIASLCVSRDHVRWSLAEGPPHVGTIRLYRKPRGGSWAPVALPEGKEPWEVQCDDPRWTWVKARSAENRNEGNVILRSAPVEQPIELVESDHPVHIGKAGREPIIVSSVPVQPATPACATLLALVQRAGAAATVDLGALPLPPGSTWEVFGTPPNAWVGAVVPTYDAGRALVKAARGASSGSEARLLCAVVEARAPLLAGSGAHG